MFFNILNNKNKKYEMLQDDTIIIEKTTLYRIRALKDFGNIKKGQLGGYIEKENNLSYEKNDCSWIETEVIIKDNVKVSLNSYIVGFCVVSGNAIIENTIIEGNASVKDFSYLKDCKLKGYKITICDNTYLKNVIVESISKRDIIFKDSVIFKNESNRKTFLITNSSNENMCFYGNIKIFIDDNYYNNCLHIQQSKSNKNKNKTNKNYGILLLNDKYYFIIGYKDIWYIIDVFGNFGENTYIKLEDFIDKYKQKYIDKNIVTKNQYKEILRNIYGKKC